MHVELGVLHAGLLEKRLGLVEILFDGDARIVVLEHRAERLIVADGAVAEQDLVDELLARQGKLQGHAEVVAVEGRNIGAHGVGEGEVALRREDGDGGLALQEANGLEAGRLMTSTSPETRALSRALSSSTAMTSAESTKPNSSCCQALGLRTMSARTPGSKFLRV